MTQLVHAYIYGEGAIIDTNGSNPTILQKLEPPTGSGVTATGLTVSGTGYVDIPYVQISGGGGFGATALAIIDASGNLTGIKMTNPGVDYTGAPTFTLLGGGPNATGSITGNATLAPNVTTAGLIKNGAGTLSLNGNNTYTGGTTVNGGTIAINTPTALGSGALVINAAGAGIDETGGVAGGGTKPIPALSFVSNTPETWNADLVYGGTRNMTIGGPVSLGTSAAATRTLTTNTAPAGFSASALDHQRRYFQWHERYDADHWIYQSRRRKPDRNRRSSVHRRDHCYRRHVAGEWRWLHQHQQRYHR